MDKKAYWCPKCGRIFFGAISFRKHEGSKQCELNQEKDEKEKKEACNETQQRQSGSAIRL